ncbi:hypothetical protein M5E03_03065 [Bacillus safensis]|uniref:hypothetical protein n=1 Tax=Bacillus TaxID=1386 RepID=UPI000BA76137|nr:MULTISPECIES: hypothetical protein [Bacillus]MDI6562386.1 hypothetical protein [Bacillus altitudinis]PAK34122.1 hypothetical protein CHI04_12600 [Bacillus safensis]USD79698.1 hypothetical protein M5E03_03065 [Bacillus safensis]
MNNYKIEQLTNFLDGITLSEWNRVKQNVDILFSSKAVKLHFDDLEQLQANLKQESVLTPERIEEIFRMKLKPRN